ncbi:uncharacterized protein Dwil_GK22130 [Drosophila willistoni]|uniref:Uncharacterized protein n=1 Tax=Drosophila willistoni TaxID=7260 RepID=B4MY67_DROWI|nr:uncharacterized protein LOC6643340 [Drosophila willistoni]EDW77056.1 uncharacterized protein Dwil_GK22130 [Drosophila willistoni]
MSSIEIPDSEEDEENVSEEKVLELEYKFNVEERPATPVKPDDAESNFDGANSTEHTPKKRTVLAHSATGSSPSSSDATTTSPTTANGTESNDNTKSVRHRARKTQHQPRPTDTDIQFETIASGVDSPTEAHVESTSTPAKQLKMLHEEDSSAQGYNNQIQVAITEMLNKNEMQDEIKRIARERVRCNFLLATYQLPDMNFTLNTSIDTLRNQFLDRLKQRREKARLAALAKGASVKKTIVKAKPHHS